MADDAFRRDNHFVSCGYLKRWADREKRIWAYRTLVSHSNVPTWKHASFKGLAYHQHLYTRALVSGQSDEIERWLASDFEAPAEGPIDKLIHGSRMTCKDWKCIIRYVAAQDVRTPARFAEMMERWEHEMPDTLERALQTTVRELETAARDGKPVEGKRTPTSIEYPAKVTIEARPDQEGGFLKYETVVGRAMWLSSLQCLLMRTARVLLNHRWTVLLSPPDVKWVTSDNPVVRLNYYGRDGYDFRGGWNNPGTEILLPLDPRHLLYTKIGGAVPRRDKEIDHKMAERMQRFLIENAHRLVLASECDEFVPRIRPRVVDAVAYQSEIEQWKQWHERNSLAEQNLLS